jgi:hypothetical protein
MKNLRFRDRLPPTPLIPNRAGECSPGSGLHLLLDAYNCAQQMVVDVWQFALELECLQQAGLTNTALRRLLVRGYLEQRIEDTRPDRSRRTFRQVGNLSLLPGSCFVLTEDGRKYAAEMSPTHADAGSAESGAVKPVWDDQRWELRLGQAVVKRFRQPADNQMLILAVFQEEDWPPRIDDPLPPSLEQDSKRRLQSTISNLNRLQDQPLLRFKGGGDAQSIAWRVVREAEPSEDRARTE